MSNKTPRATVKKTKLARNFAVTAFFVALLLAILLSLYSTDQAVAPSTNDKAATGECSGFLLEREVCFSLERVETNEARAKGLSGRDNLAPGSGMLFVFDSPAKQCIWMKDMKFNLDIVWLDESKKVTKIEKDVRPDTYPASFCADNTKYVIELNAGDAAKLGMSTGKQMAF